MHSFEHNHDTSNDCNSIRAKISEALVEHQAEYGKILELFRDYANIISAESQSYQHEDASETVIAQQDFDAALESLEDIIVRIETYNDECDHYMEQLKISDPEADKNLPMLINAISDDIFLDHSLGLLEEYENLYCSSSFGAHYTGALVEPLSEFSLASTTRCCEMAHLRGTATEGRTVSRMRVKEAQESARSFIANASELATELADATNQGDTILRQADCYNDYETDDGIAIRDTGYLRKLLARNQGNIALLQTRLEGATTLSEIKFIQSAAMLCLEVIENANTVVWENAHGSDEIDGVIPALFDDNSRDDNPHMQDALKIFSSEGDYAKLMQKADAFMKAGLARTGQQQQGR